MSLTAGLEPQDVPTLAFPSEQTRLGPPPRAAVWTAASVIAFLALVGLYRGVTSGRPDGGIAPRFAILAGLHQPQIDAAAPAVVIPRSDEWSTLSGPKMADASTKPVAPAPKAAAKPDDDSDDDAAAPGAADTPSPDADAADKTTAPVAAAPPPAATAKDAPAALQGLY